MVFHFAFHLSSRRPIGKRIRRSTCCGRISTGHIPFARLLFAVLAFYLSVGLGSLGEPAHAQGFGGGGSSAGSRSSDSDTTSFNLQNKDYFNGFAYRSAGLTIQGSAVIDVEPEKLRVVLAVTTEAETSVLCHQANEKKIKKVREVWRRLGIGDDKVVEDFIAVLPAYKWNFKRIFPEELKDFAIAEDEKVDLVEDIAEMVLKGYRIQSNLHLEVATEAEAMKAINASFELGINDIISFDYWSSKTDAARKDAMKKAFAEAKDKADLLIEVFDEKPNVRNVTEDTRVIQPQRLYKTFTNTLEEEFKARNWNRYTEIKVYPPKQSFYKGLESNADVQASSLPMKPSIVVTSRVVIHYRNPVDEKEIK